MSRFSSLQSRIAEWSKRRHGVDVSPLAITSRRVYILPTGLGITYAVIVIAMGLGGMNYGNNLALLLAFLLAALGFVAMHHCQRNLVGLTVNALGNAPVFAGQTAHITIRLDNPYQDAHLQLVAETEIGAGKKVTPILTSPAHAEGHGQVMLALPIPAKQRGWLKLSRLVVSTTYPFALFRAWTVIHLPLQCLIYPRPSEPGNAPPPLAHESGQSANLRSGDEDFAGFRTWQAGDPPSRIAWKQYARGQELLVQQHSDATQVTHMFDWQTLHGLNVEARLSRLTRWIVDAQHRDEAFGLKIPGFSAAPASGDAHVQHCLTTLALFEGTA